MLLPRCFHHSAHFHPPSKFQFSLSLFSLPSHCYSTTASKRRHITPELKASIIEHLEPYLARDLSGGIKNGGDLRREGKNVSHGATLPFSILKQLTAEYGLSKSQILYICNSYLDSKGILKEWKQRRVEEWWDEDGRMLMSQVRYMERDCSQKNKKQPNLPGTEAESTDVLTRKQKRQMIASKIRRLASEIAVSRHQLYKMILRIEMAKVPVTENKRKAVLQAYQQCLSQTSLTSTNSSLQLSSRKVFQLTDAQWKHFSHQMSTETGLHPRQVYKIVHLAQNAYPPLPEETKAFIHTWINSNKRRPTSVELDRLQLRTNLNRDQITNFIHYHLQKPGTITKEKKKQLVEYLRENTYSERHPRKSQMLDELSSELGLSRKQLHSLIRSEFVDKDGIVTEDKKNHLKMYLRDHNLLHCENALREQHMSQLKKDLELSSRQILRYARIARQNRHLDT